MQSALISVLALSAGALAAPSAPRALTCSASSKGFAWSVTGFQFNATETYTTPAHQIDNGVVLFNISNPALSPTQVSSGCYASSSQAPDYFYGGNNDCTDPENDSNTKTTFAFNAEAGTLSVNQTWTCTDTNPPSTFFAAGTVVLSSTCTAGTSQNDNWAADGTNYKVDTKECTAQDGPLLPFVINAST